MGRICVLGSGYAVAEEGHENTELLVEAGGHCILVDCANSPTGRLKRAGVAFDQITDIFLTHFHPDHVAGVPGFLMDSWLLGRSHPLHIYGLPYTIGRMEAMLELYEWKRWPGFYPVIFHPLPEYEMSLAVSSGDLKIYTSPVKHLIPTIGLRFEFLQENQVWAYSCDTEPCSQVIELARDADGLIHEATGASVGHSSAAQAAHVALQAQARSLYLIHYSPKVDEQAGLISEAKKVYSGNVQLAVDGMVLNL